MKITVLGSGSPISNSERATSGYLIESAQSKIVLDLGFGCFKNLQKKVNPLEIGAICFSHFAHPDHTGDLAAFLFSRKVQILHGAVPSQINLFGPVGFNDFMAKLMNSFSALANLNYPIKSTELEYNSLKIFSFNVKTKPVKHSDVNTIGFRIESGAKAIMYSGDSEYTDNLVDLAKDADLAVLECGSAKPKADGHLCSEECARIAKLANAKALMLTHFYPETEAVNMEEMEKIFSGKIIKAHDLLEVEV